MKHKVLIAAGGTGGHLLPAQQLAEILQKQGAEIVFAGYKLTSSPYFRREQFRFQEIVSASLQEKRSVFAKSFFRGFLRAVWFLLRERPKVVIGFGSYHAAPVLLAAALFGKKIVLYEPNQVMGKVNRLFAPFAKRIAVQFPFRSSDKFVPIRFFPWLRSKAPEKAAACREFGLDPHRPIALVFGGSQGAAFLNDAVPEMALPNTQIIHLAGSEEAAQRVRQRYFEKGTTAVVKAFESNMPMAYAAADFAICRSGAGTLAELIRFHVPALLIPYPFATDDHQRHNAEFLTKLGGAIMQLQKEATPEILLKQVQKANWAAMKLALRTFEEQNRNRIEFDALVREL